MENPNWTLIATWTLVGVTIALVFVGGWYAYETHQIVVRMDKEREDRIRPILTFSLFPWVGLVKLRVQNVGAGPALDISGIIKAIGTEGEATTFQWHYPVLQPGTFEEFGVPTSEEHAPNMFSFNWIREHVEVLTAEFDYKSVTGSHYHLKESINVSTVTSSWIESRMLATEDNPERIWPRIAKTLENISGSLKTLTRK